MDYFLQALQLLAVDRAGNTQFYDIPLEHREPKEPEREEGNLFPSNSDKGSKQG